ncbi:hypothetical protein ACIPMW_15900 [Streptomyces sp. NPDC086669]|uniref:hypothetical protein n=1 Tax=Streptomyces sp. NPDC086669 TaxID=3365753 RepID=UPI003826497C
MGRLLGQRETQRAEEKLRNGVARDHWQPIGSALIIQRLDRLVELAEAQLRASEAAALREQGNG